MLKLELTTLVSCWCYNPVTLRHPSFTFRKENMKVLSLCTGDGGWIRVSSSTQRLKMKLQVQKPRACCDKWWKCKESDILVLFYLLAKYLINHWKNISDTCRTYWLDTHLINFRLDDTETVWVRLWAKFTLTGSGLTNTHPRTQVCMSILIRNVHWLPYISSCFYTLALTLSLNPKYRPTNGVPTFYGPGRCPHTGKMS